ncbi:hypothetical protein ACP4OV_011844 [Aristida adscensionis]
MTGNCTVRPAGVETILDILSHGLRIKMWQVNGLLVLNAILLAIMALFG